MHGDKPISMWKTMWKVWIIPQKPLVEWCGKRFFYGLSGNLHKNNTFPISFFDRSTRDFSTERVLHSAWFYDIIVIIIKLNAEVVQW